MSKRQGPYSVKEFAEKKGKSESTIRLWAQTPQDHAMEVEKSGGRLIIWQIIDDTAEIIQSKSPDLDRLPTDFQFEVYLEQKVVGKTTSQRTSIRKYYRDQYKKTGVIPKGLLYREGRKASGRKGGLSKEITMRFIEMVKNSAIQDVDSSNFITQKLRTVVNFHRRLEDQFGNIPIDSLYRLVVKYNLKKYIEKPDYSDTEIKKLYCFKTFGVFDLIQIDGCQLTYLEIKDESDHWRHPHVIEFMDIGSRKMLSMDIHFSESNESSVESFSNFLRSTRFPQKQIRFKPDRSQGFKNLKRPIRELNRKYALIPGKFFLCEDFARPGKPKDKAHLESSHRRLHGFEDFIILKLSRNKLVERRAAVKMKNNKMETITISRIDIRLDELRSSGLIEQYVKEHNERLRTFSESGKQQRWRPNEKFEAYLKSVETFQFKEADIEECLKYGFKKENASVSHKGEIRFKKCDYQVVSGDFYGSRKRVKVKVSKYNDKLYIFEPSEDGIAIGEAVMISEYEEPEGVKRHIRKKLKQNEFEQLVSYLKKQGMTIKNEQIKRLAQLKNQGLDKSLAMEIVKLHKHKYDLYRKNQNPHTGIILCNLFFAHFVAYEKSNFKGEKS